LPEVRDAVLRPGRAAAGSVEPRVWDKLRAGSGARFVAASFDTGHGAKSTAKPGTCLVATAFRTGARSESAGRGGTRFVESAIDAGEWAESSARTSFVEAAVGGSP
jgi:hypothetical protein